MIYNKDIDLNMYKAFYAVAKSGSFTKAAEILYISQPAISVTIKKLEAQLETKLFKRDNKGIKLTEKGEQLLFYVESAFNTIHMAEEKLDSFDDIGSEIIRIGSPSHISIFLLSNLIVEFRKNHPNIKFFIVNRSTKEMIKMLKNREISMIIDNDAPILNDLKHVIITKLIDLENCFVGNEKYKNLSNKKINFETMNKYELLLPSTRTLTRVELEKIVRKSNSDLLLDPVIDVSITEVMYELVKKGLGIGYFPKLFVIDDIKTGKLYEIKTILPLPKTELCCVYVPEFMNSVERIFFNYMKERLGSDCKYEEEEEKDE
ncbi:MAG: LysR family transcriptional regulator [Bacilli bacterium]